MPYAEPLSREAIEAALAELKGWRFAEDRLQKTYTFGSFREAVSFIVRIAFEAEQQNHHPELHNVYNRVTIALTTHAAGNRVTARDVELARAIERIAWV
ncbi:4a-hydroxytetrahydrobiopterin dehydratase [Rhodothermus bifroesti]|jgi:4a-hydroxytetrahydrobiopterin dehydratase|uniref:Putative pterin-4-alpha-carbinolamine dehydratase n=1 Tax=Rhodothermus marinus TaxID=29549 RepID=A0A7V2F6M7_RHOMR|nr:4a-hydroxytetrahydrobiopterin dehydratase [Rhodothermus bifroesti]GBD00966.1 Putative pterin-4-alpha-carbinolamine dehydratase [bacterium HR18]